MPEYHFDISVSPGQPVKYSHKLLFALFEAVDDGRLLKLQGDPDHPMTAGFACAKVNREHEWVHSPERVLTPLKLVGAKGEGRFQPVSWAADRRVTSARVRSIL